MKTRRGSTSAARTTVTQVLTVSLAVATLGLSGVLVAWRSAAAAGNTKGKTATATATIGASISCAGTSNLLGAQGTAGAASGIDATSISRLLLESVAKAAGSKISGPIAGWALDSIFGSSTGNTDEVKAQLDQMANQLTSLNNQVQQLHTQLNDMLKKLEWQAERNTYDGLAAQVNQDAATLSDYQIRFDSWLKRGLGSQVSASQSDILLGMRRDLGKIINDLNNAMTGGAPGARGLIEVYGSVTQKHLSYASDLTDNRFSTSEFTTPVSNQLDYYEGLTVQAFTMLAEVNHLSWTIGGSTYDADTPYVETYANCLPKLLANWNQMATSGAGRLPDGTVADASTGLMWARSNLSAPGDGNPIPEAFCWQGCFIYPQQSLSTWLTPSRDIGGLSGWRVPSKAEFDALVAGHTTSPLMFLHANGFKWRDSTSIKIDGYPVTVPAYWVNGGSTVSFHDGYRASGGVDYGSWLATFLPGPGAVSVRNIG